jgi:hypothetical protein
VQLEAGDFQNRKMREWGLQGKKRKQQVIQKTSVTAVTTELDDIVDPGLVVEEIPVFAV